MILSHKFEYGYNYKLAKKFIILQSAFDKLGISKEEILTSNPKGIYFGFTSDKSKDFLSGKINDIPNISNDTKIQSCDSIFTKWLNKYAKNRFKSLTENNNMKLVYTLEKINIYINSKYSFNISLISNCVTLKPLILSNNRSLLYGNTSFSPSC